MSDINIDKQVQELLRDIVVEELERDRERYRAETASCMTFARTRELSFDLAEATAAERDHLFACRHCSARLNGFQESLHPGMLELIQYELGMLDAERKSEIHAHLRTEDCWQCQRLTRTHWVATAVNALRKGLRSVEQIRESLAHGLRAPDYIPAQSIHYASDEIKRAPFSARKEMEGLTVILEERPGDALLIHVEASDASLKSSTIHVEIVGEGEPVVAEIKLEQHGEFVEGRKYLSDFSKLQKDLNRIMIFALPLTDDDAPSTGRGVEDKRSI